MSASRYRHPLTNHYRCACAKLETIHGPFLPRRSKNPTWKRSRITISWEAFGLASDLRNANYTCVEIETWVGFSPTLLAYHWHFWFPELCNPTVRGTGKHKCLPQTRAIIELLDRGLSWPEIRSTLGVNKNQIAGAANRRKIHLARKQAPCPTP